RDRGGPPGPRADTYWPRRPPGRWRGSRPARGPTAGMPSCADPFAGDRAAWQPARAGVPGQCVTGDGDVVFEVQAQGLGDALPPGEVFAVGDGFTDDVAQGDCLARAA